jgi:hypothetical protein
MKSLYFFALVFLMACSSENKKVERQNEVSSNYAEVDLRDSINKLSAVGNPEFEYGQTAAFLNQTGDTIIPFNRYEHCFLDTFSCFTFVQDSKLDKDNIVGINRKGKVVFEAFLFDNGPDYLSDGLFRIIRNGKIGFANKYGQIVVPPIYSCAYPFEDGKAKVTLKCETIKDELEHSSWKSKKWFYIDKNGKKLN